MISTLLLHKWKGRKIINKYKKLFSDALLFSISVFASKILSFFMLPIYTSVLSPDDFGTVDIIVTTVNLLIPIITLSISEAVLRFSLDKNESKKDIFSLGLWISLISLVVLLLLTSYIGEFLKLTPELCIMFVLIYITTMFYTLLNQFLRGIDEIKVFAVNGVLSTLTLVLSNIILLIFFKIGIMGYLLSIIISNTISIIYMVFCVNLVGYITFQFNLAKLNDMLRYCVPLIFITTSWWILFSSDRYILRGLAGIGVVGIYSAANRLPAIFTSITDIFMKAWQISAVNEYESDNRNQYYHQIYKYYNILLLVLCSLLIIFIKVITQILFSAEFYSAWKCSSFLMLSAVFSALNGFIGSLYTTAKRTTILFVSTILGASINIGLNFLLIPKFNETGAAIATLCGFFSIWLMRSLSISEEFKTVGLIKFKFCLSYGIILAQCFIMWLNLPFKFFILTALFFVIIFIFYKDIIYIIEMCKKAIKGKILTKGE